MTSTTPPTFSPFQALLCSYLFRTSIKRYPFHLSITNAMKSSPMIASGWATIGFEVHQPNHGFDLIQNCDLPPPHKIFRGSDNSFASINAEDKNGGGVEKVELLKALRLSQTRAREAESKAEKMARERNGVCNALLAEAMKVLTYRQSVKVLEFQVSKLRNRSREEDDDDDDGGKESGLGWILGFAICLGIGIAGVGLAFSYASLLSDKISICVQKLPFLHQWQKDYMHRLD